MGYFFAYFLSGLLQVANGTAPGGALGAKACILLFSLQCIGSAKPQHWRAGRFAPRAQRWLPHPESISFSFRLRIFFRIDFFGKKKKKDFLKENKVNSV